MRIWTYSGQTGRRLTALECLMRAHLGDYEVMEQRLKAIASK